MENKKSLILLSGISGAGKTTVASILEDLGYHCLDQFPAGLIESLYGYIEKGTDPRFDRLVLTLSLIDFKQIYTYLSNVISDITVIMVDANQDVVLNRYKFTRRIHPLMLENKADTLEMAIEMEKKMMSDIYNDSMITIDTTTSTLKSLRLYIEDLVNRFDETKFGISFVSFGYKYGVARDADFVFDVRFLDNPYYIEELRDLNGNDEEVYEYVINKPLTKQYIQYLIDVLDFIFKNYIAEGKRHLTIAIGCTGGKHRSISVVRYLYKYYADKYLVFIKHRDEEKK